MSSPPDASTGSPEANKAIVLRYFLETHNAPHDLSVIDELLEPTYGERIKGWMNMEIAAFPDERYESVVKPPPSHCVRRTRRPVTDHQRS